MSELHSCAAAVIVALALVVRAGCNVNFALGVCKCRLAVSREEREGPFLDQPAVLCPI